MSIYRATAFSLIAMLLCACQSAPQTLTPQQQDELDGQLILAAYGANLEEVERLLAAGADPSAQAGEQADVWFDETDDGSGYAPIGSRQWTALVAALNNWRTYQNGVDIYPLCMVLIEAGIDLDIQDNHGSTALYSAIHRHETEVALMLIRHGADVNTETEIYIDASEGSPLWLAIRNRNRPMFNALLTAGAVIDSDEVMWEAIKSRDAWIMQRLIHAGADVHVTYTYLGGPNGEVEYSRTLLLEAIREHPDYWENQIIRRLIKAGATFGVPEEVDAASAYYYAMPNPELVRRLVEHGLSPAETDQDGWTPLHHAASSWHYDFDTSASLYQLLQAEEIDIDVRDTEGRTPLYYAVHEGNLAAIGLLLEAGADPNGATDLEDNYLHHALLFETSAAVAILLAYGADPLIEYEDGQTVLEFAEKLGGFQAALIRAAIEKLEDEDQ